jgi:hypothetical protein
MNSRNSTPAVTLCLLTWNEIEGCKQDVPRIPKIFDRVFAIDNSSTDGTREFLESNGIDVIPQYTKSYNGAYLDAIDAAGSSSVVFFHPKGTVEVESLETAYAFLQSGYDFVLASRIGKGAQNEEDHRLIKPRKWFVIGIALVAKVRWGLIKRDFLDDPLHGYRAVSASYIGSLKLRSTGITADVEMIKHAYSGEFKLATFPVQEVERSSGTTHFPAFSTGRQILKYVFSFNS